MRAVSLLEKESETDILPFPILSHKIQQFNISNCFFL